MAFFLRRSATERQTQLDDLPDVSSSLIYDYVEKGEEHGVFEWQESGEAGIHLLPTILPLPEKVKARLCLIEGLEDNAEDAYHKSQIRVPSEFFDFHKSNTIRGINTKVDWGACSFFAKWSRRVKQNDAMWENESRIRKGTPYDIDTVMDPRKLHIDHQRYTRSPKIRRPYSPTLKTAGGEICHAATECISCYWKHDSEGFVGVIVFDPSRILHIHEVRYNFANKESSDTEDHPCFVGDSCSRERFIGLLNKCRKQEILDRFEDTIQNIVVQMMLNDIAQVLPDINESLDQIDLAISDDDVLDSSLQTWRDQFGPWRKDLLHQIASLGYVSTKTRQLPTGNACAGKSWQKPSVSDKITVADVKQDLETTSKRVDSTFQAIMSTMSIVESRKAITEAETVTKLTQLAFFFIPLSFVCGVFGMNIVEFDRKLKAWYWIIVSIGVIFSAYVFLYWKKITTSLPRSRRYFRALNVPRFRARMKRWIRILFHYSVTVIVVIIFLGWIAGFGVGLWKLYTSSLSPGAKGGISVAIFVVHSLLWCCFTVAVE